MSQTTHVMTTRKGEILQDPPLVQKIFSDRRAGWFWFILRIWLGWQWLSASMHKITNPAWVGGGEALKGFLGRRNCHPRKRFSCHPLCLVSQLLDLHDQCARLYLVR